MNYYNRIKELATANRNAKTDEERFAVKAEMLRLEKENPDEYAKALESLIKETSQEIEEISITEQMKEVSQIVSMAYIAKHYFRKSRGWLSQRLHGNSINGKPAQFNEADMETLRFALKDISQKLGTLSSQI